MFGARRLKTDCKKTGGVDSHMAKYTVNGFKSILSDACAPRPLPKGLNLGEGAVLVWKKKRCAGKIYARREKASNRCIHPYHHPKLMDLF